MVQDSQTRGHPLPTAGLQRLINGWGVWRLHLLSTLPSAGPAGLGVHPVQPG
jgi:hypothetical protein